MNKKEIRKIYNYALEDLDKIILDNPKYINAREKCNKLENELKDFIGQNGYKKFENFMEEYVELESIENEEIFVQVFSMANKLIINSLDR